MKRYLLAGTSVLALLVGAAGAHATTFNFTGAVVDFTIPVTGTYDITAAGAEGGNGFGSAADSGGLGALAGGDVFLTAGTVLDIAVGGVGGTGNFDHGYGGGGGGGSFVFTSASSPLVIAGGGGGADVGLFDGGPGQNTTAGQAGGGTYGGAGGTGGAGSSGGAAKLNGGGGGGGGWLGSGTAGAGEESGGGGDGPATFAGGPGAAAGADGGFGGGGGVIGGGGGGGYSGGGGAGIDGGSGGGGSYVASDFTNPELTTGGATKGGNGYVSVALVSAAIPEPASLGLLAAAFAGLGLIRRRRRG